MMAKELNTTVFIYKTNPINAGVVGCYLNAIRVHYGETVIEKDGKDLSVFMFTVDNNESGKNLVNGIENMIDSLSEPELK